MFRAAFPDLEGIIEDMIAEGDKVVVRGTVRGTHQGELLGLPCWPHSSQLTRHLRAFRPQQLHGTPSDGVLSPARPG
ncbi:MAG: ester cyclase [Pseudomonadota bacterium]|nr:ester cyclase [Pseudomonadota bacterium]